MLATLDAHRFLQFFCDQCARGFCHSHGVSEHKRLGRCPGPASPPPRFFAEPDSYDDDDVLGWYATAEVKLPLPSATISASSAAEPPESAIASSSSSAAPRFATAVLSSSSRRPVVDSSDDSDDDELPPADDDRARRLDSACSRRC